MKHHPTTKINGSRTCSRKWLKRQVSLSNLSWSQKSPLSQKRICERSSRSTRVKTSKASIRSRLSMNGGKNSSNESNKNYRHFNPLPSLSSARCFSSRPRGRLSRKKPLLLPVQVMIKVATGSPSCMPTVCCMKKGAKSRRLTSSRGMKLKTLTSLSYLEQLIKYCSYGTRKRRKDKKKLKRRIWRTRSSMLLWLISKRNKRMRAKRMKTFENWSNDLFI